MNNNTALNVSSEKNVPLFSIITVVYNGVNTIEQTIQSVINQIYEHKEYIIIDGGSTDGTIAIIKKYAAYLSFWVSERDNGIYDAMNKGISHSQGNIIGILNADDWYEPDILSKIAAHYLEYGFNHVTHGIMRIFSNEEFYSIVGNSVHRLRYDMIQHPTCFVPSIIYQTHGIYDVKYKYSADYDLILKYVNSGVKFHFLEEIITNFRLGGLSSISNAEIEMYKVRAKHHFISKMECALRIIQVVLTKLIKRIIF